MTSKALTVPAFLGALANGYNINVATTTLDAAGTRMFASFTPGGGMGLPEMTGSPNLTLVPEPATFRVLPWAPGATYLGHDQGLLLPTALTPTIPVGMLGAAVGQLVAGAGASGRNLVVVPGRVITFDVSDAPVDAAALRAHLAEAVA